MSVDDIHGSSDTAADCTTTTSFAEHGVPRGSLLIQRTYYRLAAAGVTEFTHSEEFFDHLEAAFRGAYVSSTGEPGLPPHVEAALSDALAWTRSAFADVDSVDLRTELLPRFYSELAGFHCAYQPADVPADEP